MDEDKICCPNCEANLEEQWGFSEYNYDWTCTECGASLHREYTSDEFEQEDDEEETNYTCPVCDSDLVDQYGFDEDYIHTNDTEETHYYSNTQSGYRDFSYFDKNSVLPEDKSVLRKCRVKAFFTSRKKVPIGYSTQQLIGKNYREVETRLYNQAFKNIQLKSQKDIYVNSSFEDGEVESVLINGTAVFSSQKMYPYDSEIIITYHEKREIMLSFAHGNIRRMNYNDVQKKFTDLGFVNISIQPIKDLITGWIKKDGSVESVGINGNTNYRKGAVFKFDVSIVIEYHTFKNRH